MRSWLIATVDGVALSLTPVRLTRSWSGRAITLLISAAVVGVIIAGAFLTATGRQPVVVGREYPLNVTQTGIATLSFVLLLFVIATVRQRKRLNEIGDPLRRQVALFIRLGSDFLPIIASCKTGTELQTVSEGIRGWNGAVYDTLRKRRMDWALRFTGAYPTREMLEQAPQSHLGQAPRVWADLHAQLEVLKEMFRESSGSSGANSNGAKPHA